MFSLILVANVQSPQRASVKYLFANVGKAAFCRLFLQLFKMKPTGCAIDKKDSKFPTWNVSDPHRRWSRPLVAASGAAPSRQKTPKVKILLWVWRRVALVICVGAERSDGCRRRRSVLLRWNTNRRTAATVVTCLFVLWLRCFRCKCYRSSCSRLSAGNLIFVIIALLFVFVWSLYFSPSDVTQSRKCALHWLVLLFIELVVFHTGVRPVMQPVHVLCSAKRVISAAYVWTRVSPEGGDSKLYTWKWF